jgi:hypothetical protein
VCLGLDGNLAESTTEKDDTMKDLEQTLQHTGLQAEPEIPGGNLDSEISAVSRQINPTLDSQTSPTISDTTPAAMGQEIPGGERTQRLTDVLEPKSAHQTTEVLKDETVSGSTPTEVNGTPDEEEEEEEGQAKESREEQVHAEVRTNSSSMEPQPPVLVQEVDEYLLKEIDWIDPITGAEKRVKIITQNSECNCKVCLWDDALNNLMCHFFFFVSREWTLPTSSHQCVYTTISFSQFMADNTGHSLIRCLFFLIHPGNVLLLRGDIEVTPFGRPSVTFEYIASQLGNYLLSRAPSAPRVSIRFSGT